MSRQVVIDGAVRHLQGWRRDSARPLDRLHLMAEPPQTIALPRSGTLRPRWHVPQRNQGNVGDCVWNAITECMGWLYVLKGLPDPILSRFFGYWWTRHREGTPASEDSGCQIRDGIQVAIDLGVPLESLWPMVDDGKQFTVQPSKAANDNAKDHQLLFQYRCPSLRTIKTSIIQGFPVAYGFECPVNLQSAACARTGIVRFPSPTEAFIGGHAIVAAAFDDDKQLVGGPNSWGPGWGDNGWIWLPYRFFEEGLATDAHTLRREEQPEIPTVPEAA